MRKKQNNRRKEGLSNGKIYITERCLSRQGKFGGVKEPERKESNPGGGRRFHEAPGLSGQGSGVSERGRHGGGAL